MAPFKPYPIETQNKFIYKFPKPTPATLDIESDWDFPMKERLII